MATDKDALRELEFVSDINEKHLLQHYLYFPFEQNAINVVDILRKNGFIVEYRLGADGINWLVLANCQIVPTEQNIADMRLNLEEIAEKNGGEYDGWEAMVQN